jgi:TetR/AcrR family transcriptional repressor of nem operon
MNTAIDADDGNEALRDLARKAIQDWRARLSRIVETGIKAKEISSSTEPRRIANTLIATLEGALMISRLENSRHALRDAQATLESLLASIAT